MAEGIYQYVPLWNEWKIDSLIGKGSYGEVYKIYKEANGKRIEAAAKYISIPKTEDRKRFREYTDEEQTTIFDECAEKLSIEISSMLKLRESENVVRYEEHIKHHKSGETGWDIIIRMELLTPFEDYLENHCLSRRDIAKLGIDICSAICSCEKHKIIHRDIKIENIFLDPLGNFKLGDFGVSKVGFDTVTGTVTGTEDYMAPEIFSEHRYNKTVDIYALGIVLYRLLNNRRKPFIDADCVPGPDAEEKAHLKRIKGKEMPPPRYAEKELARIVLKACAFNKRNRYLSAEEMAFDLKKVICNLSDEAVLLPRKKRLADFSLGRTEREIPNKKSDMSDDSTISDVMIPEPQKKKKYPWIIGGVIGSVSLIAILIIAFIISNPPIEDILNLPEETVYLTVDDTFDLNPTVASSKKNMVFTYQSEDQNLATVNNDGLIVAKNAGKVKIFVRIEECTESVVLNIAPKKIPVADITGLDEKKEMNVGDEATVTCTVKPDNATEKEISFESSDINIATISQNGVIKAIAEGDVKITATAGGITKTMNLTVKKVQDAISSTTKIDDSSSYNNNYQNGNYYQNEKAINAQPNNNDDQKQQNKVVYEQSTNIVDEAPAADTDAGNRGPSLSNATDKLDN